MTIASNHWLRTTPIAHRGLFSNPDVPENSLAAFRRCVKANCPIELDIRLLNDGSVVVFHDGDLKRLTGRDGKIDDFDAAGVRDLRLMGTDEPVPLLGDVLEMVDGAVPILIEIKSESHVVGELESAALRVLEKYQGEFAVQSFNPLTVNYIAKHAPEVVRGQLGGMERLSLDPQLKAAVDNMVFNAPEQPHFIAYDIDSLPDRRVSSLRAKGVALIAWTIKTPEQKLKAEQVADNYIFEEMALCGDHQSLSR